MKIKKIFNIMSQPKIVFQILGHRGYLKWIPDKIYLKILYWLRMKKRLNLRNTELFTEKLQWLKLKNRKKDYTTYVDKFAVREHISKQIGENYLIPLIASYDRPEDIDWDVLPEKFVVKYNHGSGTNIICTDKSKIDIEKAYKKLKKWEKQNWYWMGREWPYKNMKKKVIIEEFLEDHETIIPNDYKFWMFNGKVEYINVHFEKNGESYINIYDTEWNLQPFGMVYKNDLSKHHKKPYNLDKMKELAEKLSEDLPFVRIDFYEVNSKIYFGEITFFPTSGFITFHPNHKELDEMYGDLVELKIESKS